MLEPFILKSHKAFKVYITSDKIRYPEGDFWRVTTDLDSLIGKGIARRLGVATALALRDLGEKILKTEKAIIR